MSSNKCSQFLSFFNGLISRHLGWIYRIAVQAPMKVMVATLLLMIFCGVVISRTSFEADIFRLFPRDLPALQLLLESMEWSGGSREAYFLLEGKQELLPAETEKLVERLQSLQLDGKPAFSKVTWRVYDESEGQLFAEFIAYAVAHPQLFVAPQDAPRLASRLSARSVSASLDRVKADLSGQLAGGLDSLATADPLYFRDLILPRLKASSQSLALDSSSPYFLSRDGQVMIVIAEPARDVQDMEFARRLVSGINEARKGLSASVSCAGAHMSAVLDEAEMKSNILSCILSSLVVVLLIFYAVYRRLLPTLLLPLIIVAGVVSALALSSLFLPSIHIISFAFMALIIGLGTDYSVHLYDRYHCERVAGKEVDEALRLACVDTGHGLFTAAFTTALPFLALMISDVRALYELGLLVGLGVLLSLYSTLFFLPPLLIFMERRFPSPFRPIPDIGMRRLWQMAQGRFRVVLLISVVLFLCGFAAMFGTRFDGELKNLQPRHSEAFLAQEKIARHLSPAPKQLLIVADAGRIAEVLKTIGEVERLAERYRSAGQVRSWSSLGQVLNNQQEQRLFLEKLRDSEQVGGSAATLAMELEKGGFEPAPFMPFVEALARLEKVGTIPESEGIEKVQASPLRGVVQRHLVRDGRGYHAMLHLHYDDSELDLNAFLADLAAVAPAARATGVDLVSSQLAESVSKSFMWGFLIGGLLVLFLLITHFESWTGMFYTLFPVAGGAVMMLGSMAICSMGLNFMNAMVLITIIGMGSDYGLHVAHRIGTAEPAEREENFVQSGRAVAISALTTIAGFGSLAFADYPALASIGWATNLGVGFTALFALVTLPALFWSLLAKGKKAH